VCERERERKRKKEKERERVEGIVGMVDWALSGLGTDRSINTSGASV
jgi:hypothetical protein